MSSDQQPPEAPPPLPPSLDSDSSANPWAVPTPDPPPRPPATSDRVDHSIATATRAAPPRSAPAASAEFSATSSPGSSRPRIIFALIAFQVVFGAGVAVYFLASSADPMRPVESTLSTVSTDQPTHPVAVPVDPPEGLDVPDHPAERGKFTVFRVTSDHPAERNKSLPR